MLLTARRPPTLARAAAAAPRPTPRAAPRAVAARAPLLPRRAAVVAAAAASPAPGDNKKPGGFVAARVADLKELATPFSDPVSNRRLLALCVAQALCSVATLIHDT
jgi:hypothetical protein